MDHRSTFNDTEHIGPAPTAGAPSPVDPATPQPQPRGSRLGILRPLRSRDFALLWTAMTVSLLGDGIYLVAIAFQVYELSNSPTALSVVFFAWTAPMVIFFLLAGVLSDRFDRRKLLIVSDLIRGASIGAMGVLAVSGDLELTHLLVLAAVYGVGDALFMPAFTAIVPDIVSKNLLLEANSLDQFVRPLMMRFLGPALGGMMVATSGAGVAFLVNSVTFAFSAVAVAFIRKPKPVNRSSAEKVSALKQIAEGFRFVKARAWIWGTLVSASVGLLCFIGPLEVLIPYVVKNEMGGGAGGYGLILSAGGVGAILVSLVMGQRGLPRRNITFMFVVWGVGVLLISSFAFTRAVWQAMVASFLMTGLFTAGMIVWGTLLHKLVPSELLGRVSSLDWLVSTALVPASFILTGPAADRFGSNTTLIAAGVLGSIVTFAFLLLPGIRDPERLLASGGSAGPPIDVEAVPPLEPEPERSPA